MLGQPRTQPGEGTAVAYWEYESHKLAAQLRRRRPSIDRLAIWAFILGILSVILFVFCVGFVVGPVAAIVGLVALRKIRHSESSVRGGGTATAGIVLGIAGLVASILWWIHSQSLPPNSMFCVGPGGNLC